MNTLKKLAGQTAIYGMSSMLGRLLNYLLVPIYTRVFMPSEFGVVAELYAYIAFLNVLLTYGMETSFFRHYNKENGRAQVFSTAFFSIFSTSLLFLGFVLLLRTPISELIRYSHHPEYIIFVAAIVVLDALGALPFARLRADNKPKTFAFIKLFNIGVNIGFNLFFIIFCPYVFNNNISPDFLQPVLDKVYNPDIGVGYIFIANLIASGSTLLVLLPSVLKTHLYFNIHIWKRMIWYALPLLLAGFTGIINETIDRILLKFMLPADVSMTQLGIYGACYKISIIITLFIQAFRFAAEPFFFAQASEKNAKDVYALVMKYFVITCLIIFLTITLYIDIFKHFVGSDYHEGLKVVPILLLANVFLGIYFNLSVWYKLLNKTIFGAYFSLIGAVITVVLNIIWIPQWGYMGAAWATLICYFVMMSLSFLFGRKYFKVNYDLKSIALYFSAALAIYGLSLIVAAQAEVNVLIINSFLLLSFVAVVYRFELYMKHKRLSGGQHQVKDTKNKDQSENN